MLGTSPTRSTWPRTAAVRTRARRCRACQHRGTAPRSASRPSRSPTQIGYPVVVRPSYVLGGRAWRSSTTSGTWTRYIDRGGRVARTTRCLSTDSSTTRVELDVDALCDGSELFIGGVMEHIEEAGYPLRRLGVRDPADHPGSVARSSRSRTSTLAIARGVGVRGLLNVQYALAGDVLYVLEANPRAVATVPFVSKATAVQLAKAAARIALGATIAELRDEGLLPAAGDGGDLPPTPDRGQGSRAAVPPVPHRRAAIRSTRSSARR